MLLAKRDSATEVPKDHKQQSIKSSISETEGLLQIRSTIKSLETGIPMQKIT